MLVAFVFLYVPYWIALATGSAQDGDTSQGLLERVLGPLALVIVAGGGLTALAMSAIAIFRRGERSVGGYVTFVVGLFILVFLIGELAAPH
jgi:hypothetical protein